MIIYSLVSIIVTNLVLIKQMVRKLFIEKNWDEDQ